MLESLNQSEPVLLPQRPTGRQARSVVGYSVLTALMIVSTMPVFVPAALLHCAFRHGRRAAWTALGVALLLVAAYGAVLDPAPVPDGQKLLWSILIGSVLTIALPSMAAIPMVARAETFGRVLIFLMAGALVGLALTEVGSQTFFSYSPYAVHVTQVDELAREAVTVYRERKMPPDVIRGVERWRTVSRTIVPAQMLMSIALIYTLSLMMYGRLRAWQDHAERRPLSTAARAYLFRNLQLPEWLLFAFIFGGVTPLATGLLQTVAANTLATVVFLYILQGMAVFRSMLLAVGVGPFGTVIAWGLIVLLLPVTCVVGLFDPFFDFRHFKKRKDDSHESHSD
jgi:Predicted membrane protein (DUF2232)